MCRSAKLALSLETLLQDWVKQSSHIYIVLLVLVALHDGDDAVVYEEGQSENAGQLGEEQSELCNEKVSWVLAEAARANTSTQSDSAISSSLFSAGINSSSPPRPWYQDRAETENGWRWCFTNVSVTSMEKIHIFKCSEGSSSQAQCVCRLWILYFAI